MKDLCPLQGQRNGGWSMTDGSPVFAILAAAAQNRASDIHLKIGVPPMLRIDGTLRPLDAPPLDPDQMREVVKALTAAARVPEPGEGAQQNDFALQVEGTGRFRTHLYRQRGSWAAALRVIPETVPEPDALRLPPVVNEIAALSRGLVLFGGAAGMGKSTTVASLLTTMAAKRNLHIVTIEDPIEFVIPDGKSVVSQRAVGVDAATYDEALSASFREDLDLLFIGELRTAWAVEVALQTGELGHLCFGAVGAPDVASTLARIANMIPAEQKNAMLARLAENLQAVICQRLVPMAGRASRILVAEVLSITPSLKQAIRNPAEHKSIDQMIAREAMGSSNRTFDQHLRALVREELVLAEVAEAAAAGRDDLMRA